MRRSQERGESSTHRVSATRSPFLMRATGSSAQVQRAFGTTILRTTALVAWVVPGIAGGIIWQMLFSEAPYGALNSILRMMHIPPVAWLSDPAIAPWSALLSNIWRGTAFSMVVMPVVRTQVGMSPLVPLL